MNTLDERISDLEKQIQDLMFEDEDLVAVLYAQLEKLRLQKHLKACAKEQE